MLYHFPIAFESDPYDAEEPDPAKCRASESSLWELATLQHHALPYVSKATGFLNKNLPKVEYEISEFVETTYEEVCFYSYSKYYSVILDITLPAKDYD